MYTTGFLNRGPEQACCSGRTDVPASCSADWPRPAGRHRPQRCQPSLHGFASCTASPSGATSSGSSSWSASKQAGRQQARAYSVANAEDGLSLREDVRMQQIPTSWQQIRKATTNETIGVLLLNLGGPETLDDVQPFLYNLFADPDIIRLPTNLRWLQRPLAQLISTLRAPKSAEGYKAIGGGSPLRRITDEQAAAITEALARKGQAAKVYVGMRYWRPYTEDAVEAIKADGIGQLVVLPLYPQFSVSTSGSSLRLLEELLESDPGLRGLRHIVYSNWYQRPGYVSAQADLVQAELSRFAAPGEVEIFFSAHGVPKSYVESGDPYKEEMEECVQLIMAELARRGVRNHHTLAYQSRVGPVEWLKPYTDDSIRELGAAGTRSLLAVPISFVSEHIETLEEIDMEYRELAHESGIPNWGRVPALNCYPQFIDDLADAVLEALPYMGAMAAPPPAANSLVPLGMVGSLLETYDAERRVLPPPVKAWQWGWTKSAETWNGRIAMVAFLVLLLMEAITGKGVLSGMMLE